MLKGKIFKINPKTATPLCERRLKESAPKIEPMMLATTIIDKVNLNPLG